MNWIDETLDLAQKLGNLSSSAILALVVMALAYRDYWKEKVAANEALKRLQAWQDASVADEHQTTAIQKIAEAAAMTAQAQQRTAEEVRILAMKIEERIPQRRNGV